MTYPERGKAVPTMTKISQEGSHQARWNRFGVGDVVRHSESKHHLFEIVEILISVPERKGDYLYSCRPVRGFGDRRKRWKYHEKDLLPEDNC
jgi:hypothetical protein